MFMPCLCLVDPCCRIELWTSMNIPFAIRCIPMQHFALDRNTSPRSAPFVLHSTSLLQLRRCLVFIFVFQRCLFSIVPYCSHFSFRQMWKPWLALQVQCWCGHSGRYPKRCHRRAPGAAFNRKLMASPSWELGDLPYLHITIFAHMIWRSILEGKPSRWWSWSRAWSEAFSSTLMMPVPRAIPRPNVSL